MIGAAKIISLSSTPPVLNYSVNLNPGSVSSFGVKGNLTTPTVYSTIIDGVGPYTYQWTIDNPEISIGFATSPNTSFYASGYFPDFKSGTATLLVTDLGNGSATTSAQANVSFEFVKLI